MVNYTNRVMEVLESYMGHEIAWQDRQERAHTAAHFVSLGFPGCVGLIDDTLVKLSQRPRDDGETYFDRKSNYSLNVQVVYDENKRVIYFFAELEGEDEFRPSPHGVREHNRRGIQRRQEIQDLCLEINRMPCGLLSQ
ncbi:hypothetical protein R1sor_001021 [Riccia sorocarpa]|uniref:DDE Tnp4 domain-containing protein n=1 Tax=Riccia sorocarpa TaxID=122646 RepID=A0ABD3H0T9_9MARC